MNDQFREILTAAILALLISLPFAAIAQADCVVAFGADWCGPCREMRPIEAQLQREGYDIRHVDADKDPERVKAYGVGALPCFVALRETPRGWVETGRIVGKCSAGQLRRLFVIPRATEAGAAVRSSVRALFSPMPVLEW